jgi:hypothetical protein
MPDRRSPSNKAETIYVQSVVHNAWQLFNNLPEGFIFWGYSIRSLFKLEHPHPPPPHATK